MNNKPLVSIFCFCKNAEKTIRRHIQAIITALQHYDNIEYVVQDGASTDRTLQIYEEYRSFLGNRLQLVSEHDSCVSEGFWRALPRCRGEIICASLADEEILPDAIPFVVEEFLKNPDIDIVHGNIWQTDIEGSIQFQNKSNVFNLVTYLSHQLPLHLAASFFRRSAFTKTGLLPFPNRYGLLEDDYFIWAYLGLSCSIKYYDKVFSKYAVHQSALSVNTSRMPSIVSSRLEFLGTYFERDIVPEEIKLNKYIILKNVFDYWINAFEEAHFFDEVQRYRDRLALLKESTTIRHGKDNGRDCMAHEKKQKVLLLSLPGLNTGDEPIFPLGIGYLLASLRQDNRPVQALHYQCKEHVYTQLPEVIQRLAPDIVGLTCTTFNRGLVRETCGWLRATSPHIRIVLGGVHVSFMYEQALREYGADYVVIGEGEHTLRELCTALDQNLPLYGIKGIAFLHDGQVVTTPPRETVQNLDDLPMPDYSFAGELMQRSGMGFVITSRGCPVRCSFCSTSSYWGQRVRVNSPRRAVDEMEALVRAYGVKKIFIHDDTFNLGIARVKAFCEEILARNLQVEWGVNCRVHPVSQEMIDCMVAAGCRHICWGIESGSKYMLERIDKKITKEQIKNAFDLCRKHLGTITVGAFTMVGNPGESAETIAESVAFINTLQLTDPPSTAVLYILPGTKLYADILSKHPEIERFWIQYDSTIYYTLEHSSEQLTEWANRISQGGTIVPADREKHFWNRVLFGNIPSAQPPLLPNGYLKPLQRQTRSDLPIHFFTIVLNGEPFIRTHIEAFSRLSVPWHWHIIEGVADLKHDTAWSLQHGGRIGDELHSNGLSNDGTTKYLDQLAKDHPDNITIYRKQNGQFWDGKLEMVSLPLSNITEECLLWQVDADECWTTEQITRAHELFNGHLEKMAAFYYCNFYVGPGLTTITRNTYGNNTSYEWLRTWRYRPGDAWFSHEPPQLCRRDAEDAWHNLAENAFSHGETEAAGLVFEHYAYATEGQVAFKEIYYGYRDAVDGWQRLQRAKAMPVFLKDYFPWVHDEAMVGRRTDGSMMGGARYIIWLRTDAIGDNVLASAMLPYVKKAYQDARLVMVCQDRVAPLYDACPHVDEVITYNLQLLSNENYRNIITQQLNAYKPEILLNTVYSRDFQSYYLSGISNAQHKIACEGDDCNFPPELKSDNDRNFTQIIPNNQNCKAELDRHRHFLQAIGIETPVLSPQVWLAKKDIALAEKLYTQLDLLPERTLVVFPGALFEQKKYQHFKRVLQGLHGYTLLLMGGHDVEQRCEELCAGYPGRAFNLAGKTTILQMAAVIGKARLYIGLDTSGAHVACAVGLPNVVILGGGHFGRFLPYSELTTAICFPLECYNCSWKCRFSRCHCVDDIRPDAVISAVKYALSKKKHVPSLYVQAQSFHSDSPPPLQRDRLSEMLDLDAIEIIEG